MKKLIYGSLFIALVGMGMVGCKKENVQQNENRSTSNEFGVSTDGTMLIFKTIEGYMKAVDGEYDPNHKRILDLTTKLKFNNYFSKNSSSTVVKENEMDEFFGQLLNSEGCIAIENNIYRIDLLKEKVFVINKDKYVSDRKEFISGDMNRIDVKQFELTDDVLDIMNGGIEEKAGCPSPGTITTTSYSPSGLTPLFSNTIKLGAFGIYYRVTGRSQVITTYNGYFTMEFILTGSNTQIHRRPCNNNDVTWHSTGTKVTWGSPANNEQVWEAYSKAWNVKEMYMRGKTRCAFGSPSDDGYLVRESADALIYF